ncbi:MAG: F0F1 ATP synthase subunit alpha [Verrucomicrobiota bacterium]
MPIAPVTVREIGTVTGLKQGIAKVGGLYNCVVGNILDFPPSASGLTIGFTENEALVFLMGNAQDIVVGSTVINRMQNFTVPVGKDIIGRIVNTQGQPLDGKGAVPVEAQAVVFRDAPGVFDRMPISETFETGTIAIDATLPIGRGQRELVVGDRMTGKTTICLDAIINQAGKDVICIYCCIGRAYTSLLHIIELLQEHNSLAYTTIVAALASDSAGEQYLAPYAATAIAEFFMYQGRHVFIVYDDLTKHAWAYRQLSLLLERPPGREAYPGDIFYVHSQLMERSAKLNQKLGCGSLTCLPIVETQQGDIAGYVVSNLVSMTDGQIYVGSDLFNAGFRPAVDLGLSVSRVGSKAQCKAVKKLSGGLRLGFIQYNELLKTTKFKPATGEVVLRQLNRGRVMSNFLFAQDQNRPYSREEEIVFLFAMKSDLLINQTDEQIKHFKKDILAFLSVQSPDLVRELGTGNELSDPILNELTRLLPKFVAENTAAAPGKEASA